MQKSVYVVSRNVAKSQNDCAHLLLWCSFFLSPEHKLTIQNTTEKIFKWKEGKRSLNKLAMHPWWGSFRNTPKALLYNFLIPGCFCLRYKALCFRTYIHTHTLPAHLQIFTLLFYCDSLLRDLCVCIQILTVNKVYMQRRTATFLFLTGLGAFDVFSFRK